MRLKLLLAAALAVPAVAWAYEPTANYTTKNIEGWKVYVNNKLLKVEKKLGEDALRLLEVQLYRINRVVPKDALVELHKVPIWLELRDKLHPCACYHPSKTWLKEHDYNPMKAKCVEISNARNFLSWTRSQPRMVLHELAHAYHDRVLRHGHPGIAAAYKKAVAGKSYESVLHINGRKQRAYALNNDMEYFAEATECYFGTNDFYPFVKSELKQHDPTLYDLMPKLWRLKPAGRKKK